MIQPSGDKFIQFYGDKCIDLSLYEFLKIIRKSFPPRLLKYFTMYFPSILTVPFFKTF